MDPDAPSDDPSKPAFLARPPGAPVYHGYRLVPGVECDGFRLGMVTDFLAEPDAVAGDLFVVAPDGSRAGVAWSMGSEPRFGEVLAPTAERWGVYRFEFTKPLRTIEDAQWHFDRIVPALRPRWEAWKTRQTVPNPPRPWWRRRPS